MRLIDADKVKDHILAVCCEVASGHGLFTTSESLQLAIEGIATEEIEQTIYTEVSNEDFEKMILRKQGKWITDRYCSECEWDKKDAVLVVGIPTNYCPNCGAKMEVLEEEE